MAANRLKENDKRVLNLIMSYQGAEGISIQTLKRKLNFMSIRIIWKTVKWLVNEGHIFSTIDKMHYLSTHFKYRNMSTAAINVLSWIKCFQDAEGISIEALKQGLRGMTLLAIWEAVRFLSNERYIYFTIDQDHYMSTDIINKVLLLIKTCQDAKGIHLNELNQGLCWMNMSIIRQTVEFLCNEGLIFSSIDGHHYKLTDTISKVLSLIKSCKYIEGINLRDLKEKLNGTRLSALRQAAAFLCNEGHIFSPININDDYGPCDPITYHHMSTDTISVLMVIRRIGRDVEGISLQDLEVERSEMSFQAIWKAVEYLSNEGFIYSTIDQYHYTPSNTINNVLSLTMSCQDIEGISLQGLKQRMNGKTMPDIKRAVSSLTDDGLIFSTIDAYHYTLTDTVNKVLSLIRNCKVFEGISLQDLKQGLNGISMPAIWQSVVFLKNEGCIYSTINMDHYKCHDDNDVAASPNEKVLSLIKSCQDAEGISLQGLEEMIDDMSLPVIWQAIESLSNEGYIYSTIDQYHYTSTDIINDVLTYMSFWSGGICMRDLAQICGKSVPVIKQAVGSLVDDGLIFSPIDGWHYKLTDTIDKVQSLIMISRDVCGISLQDMKQMLNGISMPAIWQAVLYLRKERRILDTIDMEHYMSTYTMGLNEIL